jgi:NADH dehydrogenase
LNFVVIGGGPTGVELAGMLATFTRQVVRDDFRVIDTATARVVLVDAGDRVLQGFAENVSASAEEQLRELGVEVRKRSRVSDVGPGFIRIGEETIASSVTIWATGVSASPLARMLSEKLDRSGRVPVAADLTLPEHPEVFVIGDMAAAKAPSGDILPGLASVAQQQGAAVAKYIEADLRGEARKSFVYRDKGLMATIGRQAAVAQWGRLHVSRTPAWLLWAFVHASLLLNFRTRSSVLREWIWSYFTRKTSAALITGSAFKHEPRMGSFCQQNFTNQ